MLGRGVRIWLAVLGLLGGLIAAPAQADGCCPGDAPSYSAEADTAHAVTCCPTTDPEPAQPAGDEERGGCECPRPCCAAPAPMATVRLPSPIAWGQAPVGTIPLAVVSARSAEYHLDLMRPPRA